MNIHIKYTHTRVSKRFYIQIQEHTNYHFEKGKNQI